jgi:hypothetical protein
MCGSGTGFGPRRPFAPSWFVFEDLSGSAIAAGSAVIVCDLALMVTA